MAAVTAASTASLSTAFVRKSVDFKLRSTCSPVVGLPALSKCPVVSSVGREEPKRSANSNLPVTFSLVSSFAAVQPALALVDDRLSTEGTGLGLGISNPLLIWIIVGIFGLIWSLYFVYASKLPAGDDDSGLSL